MEFITQVTMNTGTVRKTRPSDVDKELYFVLHRIYSEALRPGGAKLPDGYTLKSSDAGIAVLGTVFGPSGAPVITVTCSDKDVDGDVWRSLHKSPSLDLATLPSRRPALPYIADRLEIGSLQHLDAMAWTGDFAMCFGWMALAPDKIR